MRVEVGGHRVSKRDMALGTATVFGTGIFIMGVKTIAAEITRQELQKEYKEKKILLEKDIPSSLNSGDAGFVYSAQEANDL